MIFKHHSRVTLIHLGNKLFVEPFLFIYLNNGETDGAHVHTEQCTLIEQKEKKKVFKK